MLMDGAKKIAKKNVSMWEYLWNYSSRSLSVWPRYTTRTLLRKKNGLRGAKLLHSPYGKLVMTLLTKRTFITKLPKILDDANDATCLPDEKPIGDTIKILNRAKKEKNATNNYQGYYLLEELLSKAMFARGFEKEDEQVEISKIYHLVRKKKEVATKKNYNQLASA